MKIRMREEVGRRRVARKNNERHLQPTAASIFHRRDAIGIIGCQGDQLHRTIQGYVRHVDTNPHIHTLLFELRIEVRVLQRAG